MTNKIKAGEVKIIHCPTEDMIADFFTKALQGSQFRKFRDLIMGISMIDYEEYKLRYLFLAHKRKEASKKKKDAVNKAWAGYGPATMTNKWKLQEGRL